MRDYSFQTKNVSNLSHVQMKSRVTRSICLVSPGSCDRRRVSPPTDDDVTSSPEVGRRFVSWCPGPR